MPDSYSVHRPLDHPNHWWEWLIIPIAFVFLWVVIAVSFVVLGVQDILDKLTGGSSGS